ncbi:MAG TPA: hypothetical protein VMS60_12505 [Solirubrobacterales bacterium]|nr:hypothetical protein [Solirubrobacterales bacterium]
MARPRRRKLSRIQVFWRRRAARKAEAYIAAYSFPPHIERRVRAKAGLDEADWDLVERGLRQWFICCAWRGWGILGMPSRLVDEAWHEFILDSLSYTRFCEGAFGAYLHHTPDEAMSPSMSMADGTAETVRAWDRSDAGSNGEESALWDLDVRLGAAEPLGLSEPQVNCARIRAPYSGATGWACAGVIGAAGWAGDGVFIGGGEGGGGGGGDGGGGCGGGGCGGGGS